MSRFLVVALVMIASGLPSAAAAQPLGVFRWQQQPYCNVLTLNVVQAGGVYELDGTDNQCGAATQASVSGLAFPNQDGTIGMGLTIVTTPGGTPLHLDATIALATVGGSWRDSTGATGAFVFTLGGAVAGSPRPPPRHAFPAGLTVGGATITNLAAPAAPGDAVNKAYADNITATVRTAILADKTWAAYFSSTGVKLTPGRYTATRTAEGRYTVTFDVSGLGLPFPGAYPLWSYTPTCAHGHPYMGGSSAISEPGGVLLNSFSTSIAVRDAALAFADCAVIAVGVFPDANSPASPIAPLGGSEAPGASCSTVDTVTTCSFSPPD